MKSIPAKPARAALAARVLLALAVTTFGLAAQGRIVVNHDEWTFSSTGFGAAPAGATAAFAQNVGSWLNGGNPGNYLVYSGNFGLTFGGLVTAMAAGGHVLSYWTPSVGSPVTAAILSAYDGVFVSGPVPDANPNVAAELVAYVQGGGSLYLAGGTGSFGGPGNEANYWNPVLNPFGLTIASNFNGYGGVLATVFSHPIFAGVPALDFNNGNSVSALGAAPNVTIFGTAAKPGLFGVYDGGAFAPPAQYQINQPQATMTVNGLSGTAFTPPPAGGATGTLEFASTLTNAPWDLFLTFPEPVTALGAGGLLLPDGQIVNIDILSPGLFIFFNGFGGGGFPGPFSVPYALPPGSGAFSGQMVLLDSTTSTGVRLSAPIRIEP